uniref:Gustatory receptor n=1 Tax=Strigamia maritima TaxID=126957 RepID=T1JMZ0_STRMM
MPFKATTPTSYEQKFENLWNFLFWINGLQVNNNASWLYGEKMRSVAVIINTTLHLVTAVHYLLAVLYGVDTYIKINSLHAYIGFLNGFLCAFVSICSLLVLKCRKKKFLLFYRKLAFSDDGNFLKCLYKTTSIYLFLLFLVPIFTVTSITVGYNRTVASNFTSVLMFGLDDSSQLFYYAKILTFCQFLFVLIFCKYSVDSMIVYFVHICKKIARKFRILNQKLQLALVNQRSLRFNDFNHLRQRHQQICQLTEEVNQLFSPLIAIWLLGLAVSLCFDLRAFKMQFAVFYNLFFGIKILGEICLLILVFKTSAEVNSEAHYMNERILTSTISWRVKSEHHFSEVQNYYYSLNYILFSQRLSTSSIGITASGLFLINASSFLTMSASVLTYVIVLYQTS